MKKLTIFVFALVAAVGMTSIVASAAKKKPIKVPTDVTIKFNANDPGPYAPYDEGGAFTGKVKPKVGQTKPRKSARTKKQRKKLRKKCQRGRTVVVKNLDIRGNVGSTVSNKKGRYIVPSSVVTPGEYRSVARKKRIKRKGKRNIVCKKGKSTVLTVEN